MDELIGKFSLEHCSKSGAKFAFEKGKWFNHMYLQEKSNEALAELFKPVLTANGVNPNDFSDEYIADVIGLVKGRANFVKDLWEQSKFFFVAPEQYDPKAIKKRWTADTPAQLEELIGVMDGIADFNSPDVETAVLAHIADKGYHLGNLMNAFRLTVVGECKGPHMFDITRLLGKEETFRRIRRGCNNISVSE